MSIFKAGNVVRHKKPYWGEPAYYIHEVKPDGARGNPTGSKHGGAWERGGSAQVISLGSESHYRICPWYTRAWLRVLGTLVELYRLR